MLQHAVEEAAASGIKQVCIVIRKGKEVIRDYFDLKHARARHSDKTMAELEGLKANCQCTFVFQKQQLGLGDALLQDFVGTDSYVMMIPDQLMFGPVRAASQLLKRWRPGAAIWSSLLRLSKEERSFSPAPAGSNTRRLTRAKL